MVPGKFAAPLAVAGTLAVALVVTCGTLDSPDATVRYLQAKAIAYHGTLSLPASWFPAGQDPPMGVLVTNLGLYTSKYGVGLPLLWVPVLWVAGPLASLAHVNVDLVAGFLISLVNAVVTLATAASIDLVGRRVGLGRGDRAMALLAFVALNLTIPYLASSFSEPLVGLLLFWAIALPLARGSDRTSAALAGLAMAYAILVKPETAVLVPPASLALRTWGLRFLCGCVAALGPALTLVQNLVLRGSLLRFSYGGESSEFTTPWRGLYGFLLAADRNVFLLIPGTVVGVIAWARLPRESPLRPARWAALLSCLTLFLLYASWWAYDGAFAFGPRFLLPLAPIASLAAGPFLHGLVAPGPGARPVVARMLLGLAVAASLVIQAGGSAVKVNQGIMIGHATGAPQWAAHIELLAMKLARGPRGEEVYRKSDFVRLRPGEPDAIIDHRQYRTFQFLNYWWSILLANRLHGRAITP